MKNRRYNGRLLCPICENAPVVLICDAQVSYTLNNKGSEIRQQEDGVNRFEKDRAIRCGGDCAWEVGTDCNDIPVSFTEEQKIMIGRLEDDLQKKGWL